LLDAVFAHRILPNTICKEVTDLVHPRLSL
jgi:hypothetical protein